MCINVHYNVFSIIILGVRCRNEGLPKERPAGNASRSGDSTRGETPQWNR